MSISTQLERILNIRNNIRNKLTELGLVSEKSNFQEIDNSVQTITNNTNKIDRSNAIQGIFTSGQNGAVFANGLSGYSNENSLVKVPVANLVPENIKKGVNVGGVVGTYGPSGVLIKYISSSDKFFAGAGYAAVLSQSSSPIICGSNSNVPQPIKKANADMSQFTQIGSGSLLHKYGCGIYNNALLLQPWSGKGVRLVTSNGVTAYAQGTSYEDALGYGFYDGTNVYHTTSDQKNRAGYYKNNSRVKDAEFTSSGYRIIYLISNHNMGKKLYFGVFQDGIYTCDTNYKNMVKTQIPFPNTGITMINGLYQIGNTYFALGTESNNDSQLLILKSGVSNWEKIDEPTERICFLDGSYIYYRSNLSIYRVGTTGSKRLQQTLPSGIIGWTIYNNIIYAVSTNTSFKIS